MPPIPLAAMTRRARKTRRKEIVLKPIAAPATMASDLYAGTYSTVVKAWEAAIPDIIAQYERSLAAMTADSPATIGEVLTRTEGGVTSLVVDIRLALAAWAARIERWQRARWRSTVLTATGVDLDTLLGPKSMRLTMGAAIERNVGLVRSVSEQTRTRIGEAVFRGLNRRAPAAEVAKEIRVATGMARRRAMNIASNELANLTSTLNQERMREVGIEAYEWVSSHKVHYRPEHAARDGRRYELGHFGNDEPGQAIHCGCTARAVLSLDGEF